MHRAREWPKRLGGMSSDFAYVRWLGDHKAIEKITTSWEKPVLDRGKAIAAWVPLVQELRQAGVDVFGYFNNHFAGNAPASIELFREIWKQSSGQSALS